MFVLLALAACTPDTPEESQATWLDGVYFRWNRANHRLAYAHFRPDAAGDIEAALIGGLSTTKASWELDKVCDPDACREFRTEDDSAIRLGWSRITTTDLALASARADLVSDPDGETTTVSVELPGRAGDEVTALVQGFVFDSDHPLAGDPACYHPEYGWHPLRMQIAIDDVTRTSTGADVTVSATFTPGSTQDKQRACIDEVYDRSLVPISVDVLVVAGAPAEDEAVTASADYAFSGNQFDPEPQDEVPPAALSLDTSGMVGWAAIDFAFNPGKKTERGTYLRSWGFELGDDGAAGVATNFSRGTQLHGMSYTFAGTVRAVPTEGTIEKGTIEAEIPAQLLADGRPLVTSYPAE